MIEDGHRFSRKKLKDTKRGGEEQALQLRARLAILLSYVMRTVREDERVRPAGPERIFCS